MQLWKSVFILIIVLSLASCKDDSIEGDIPEICWARIDPGIYTLTLSAPDDSLLSQMDSTIVTIRIDELTRVREIEGKIMLKKYPCFDCPDVDSLVIRDVVMCPTDNQTWKLIGSCLQLESFCVDCASGEIVRFCLGKDINDKDCNTGTWTKLVSSEACQEENYRGSGIFTLEPTEETRQ